MSKNMPEYRIWLAMKTRCYNTRTRDYKNYGARGIIVCEEWKHSFQTFLSDMGPRPIGYTLERKDSNKFYNPQNCIWATWTVQGRNRRTNKLLTLNGETRCISEWSEILSIKRSTIEKRKRRGFSDEEALSTTRYLRHKPLLLHNPA